MAHRRPREVPNTFCAAPRSRRHAFRYRRAVRFRRQRTTRRRVSRQAARQCDRRQQVRIVRPATANASSMAGRNPSAPSANSRCAISGPIASTCTICIAGTNACPIEDSVGAMAELLRAGKIRAIGLSEVGCGDAAQGTRRAPHCGAAVRVFVVDAESRNRGARRMPAAGDHAGGILRRSGRGFLTGALQSPAELARRRHPAHDAAIPEPHFEENSRLLAPLDAIAAPWLYTGPAGARLGVVARGSRNRYPGHHESDAPGGKLWCGRDSSRCCHA